MAEGLDSIAPCAEDYNRLALACWRGHSNKEYRRAKGDENTKYRPKALCASILTLSKVFGAVLAAPLAAPKYLLGFVFEWEGHSIPFAASPNDLTFSAASGADRIAFCAASSLLLVESSRPRY